MDSTKRLDLIENECYSLILRDIISRVYRSPSSSLALHGEIDCLEKGNSKFYNL